jgi:glycine/D-amino acid oxidase-like deaminating enzyme
MTDYQSTDYQSKSWWLESLPKAITPNPPLTGKDKADVVVIGGGYTGLSVGYHLKQLKPDMDVRVIESDVCGYGASGRNGGFSMTLFGLTKGITKFRFNDEKARAAHTIRGFMKLEDRLYYK